MTKHQMSGWRSLRQGRPGRRFQDRYYSHRAQAGAQTRLRVAFPAVLLIVGGIILMPVPGPGTLVVVLGLALLATVSLKVARFLDWSELWLRRLLRWGRRQWRQSSPAAKLGLGISIAGGVGVAAYLGYRLLLAS